MFRKNFYIWIANDEPHNIVKIADFNDVSSYYPNGQVLELQWAKGEYGGLVALIESERKKKNMKKSKEYTYFFELDGSYVGLFLVGR